MISGKMALFLRFLRSFCRSGKKFTKGRNWHVLLPLPVALMEYIQMEILVNGVSIHVTILFQVFANCELWVGANNCSNIEINFQLYKKNIWHLAISQNWCFQIRAELFTLCGNNRIEYKINSGHLKPKTEFRFN